MNSYTYTVVYALELGGGAPGTVCHHHVACVTAAHVHDAIARCQRDTLPGYTFRTIAAFYGHLDAAAFGKDVTSHDFRGSEESS